LNFAIDLKILYREQLYQQDQFAYLMEMHTCGFDLLSIYTWQCYPCNRLIDSQITLIVYLLAFLIFGLVSSFTLEDSNFLHLQTLGIHVVHS